MERLVRRGKDSMEKRVVLGIKDRFHKFINGESTPEVRSSDACFGNAPIYDFLAWCAQHGALFSEIYVIEDGKITLYEDWKVVNTAAGEDVSA